MGWKAVFQKYEKKLDETQVGWATVNLEIFLK